MLTKEIKKMERDYPGKVITGYGTCKFCGQQAACKILEDWTRLNNIADEICEGRIKAATINIGDGVKAKLNITSQASIKVERTKTDKSAYEA